MRAAALQSVLDNYETLWEEVKESPLDSEIKARVIGVEAQMNDFNFLFGVSLGALVLNHSDNLQLAQTGKANVAKHHKLYQLLMGHSLLDHGLTFVYQMVMLGTRRDMNLNSNAFRPESSGGTPHNCNPLALACNGMEPLTKDLSHVLHIHSFPSLL